MPDKPLTRYGNGGGAEFETDTWRWDNGTWHGASSSGAGALSDVGPLQTGGHIGSAWFAYGTASGCQPVTISLDGRLHEVPVGQAGVWAFIKLRTNPADHARTPATTNPLPKAR